MEEQINLNTSNKYKKNKTVKVIIIAAIVIIFILWWWVYPATITYRPYGPIMPIQSRKPDSAGNLRPVIHIYPQEDMYIKITMSNPEKLVYTNPEYNNGWRVKVLSDGYIEKENDNISDKNINSINVMANSVLSWETNQYGDNKIKEDGFVIKGKKTGRFLDEKLQILGLNYNERVEFMTYLLPLLEKNKYNYIRFQTIDEINSNMKLNIEPKPDTLIRIMLEYKPLDEKIKVKEQKLTKIERKGYTVVEWGGTKIN